MLQTNGHQGSESGHSSLDDLSARRTACDRCRSHKLRCDRDVGSEPQTACRRCLRAGASCTTSAGAKIGRPHGHFRRQYDQHHQKKRAKPMSSQYPDTQTEQGQMLTPSPSVMGDTLDSRWAVCDNEVQHQTSHLDAADNANPPDSVMLNDVDSAFDVDRLLSGIQHSTDAQNVPSFDRSNPYEEREDILRKLGDLLKDLTMDLEIVRGCQRADECTWICDVPEFAESCTFPIGRMLQASTRLLEIVNYFAAARPAEHQQSTSNCEFPTLLSVLTCYVHLIRIYRTTFVCIADAIPIILSSTVKLPSLLPGLQLAGYSLEPDLTLQIRVLAQVAQDLLGRIDKAMGWSSQRCERIPGGLLEKVGASADLLQSMFWSELNERHNSGILVGHVKPLQEVFARLKDL